MENGAKMNHRTPDRTGTVLYHGDASGVEVANVEGKEPWGQPSEFIIVRTSDRQGFWETSINKKDFIYVGVKSSVILLLRLDIMDCGSISWTTDPTSYE